MHWLPGRLPVALSGTVLYMASLDSGSLGSACGLWVAGGMGESDEHRRVRRKTSMPHVHRHAQHAHAHGAHACVRLGQRPWCQVCYYIRRFIMQETTYLEKLQAERLCIPRRCTSEPGGGGGHASMTKTTWSLIWTVQQRKMPLAAQLGRRKRHPPTSKCQRGGLLRVSSSRSLNTLRCGWPVRRPLSASAPARHARAASAHHQGRRRCSHRRMFRR